MLRTIKADRRLTVLLTTHYMDEADKLCDRIAIVDHGKLMALDSPMKLKAAIPGENTLEVSFSGEPADWGSELGALPGVVRIEGQPPVFRLVSTSGPATTNALMSAAARAGVTIGSLSVQSTSLDDVFVHYTGHQLRDALQEPAPTDSRFMMRR
jgi:ABC-2 type transport system ATP-binding protein